MIHRGPGFHAFRKFRPLVPLPPSPVSKLERRPVFRIRIRKFRATRIPIRWGIRILPSSSKNSKKNLDFYSYVTSLYFLSLKKDVSVPSKSQKIRKNWKIVFVASWRSLTKIAGTRDGYRSVSHWYGSAYPNPYQNVIGSLTLLATQEYWERDTMLTGEGCVKLVRSQKS